jgi:NAD(P)-dependent dehydrogenase (short-subunit alcohol dehydrogenase family)
MGILDGKAILIVKATEFVGGPTIKTCLAEGARVLAQDPSFADDEARAAFVAANPGVTPTAEEDPDALVEEAVETLGGLDGVVPNDGFPAIRAKVEDADPRDMRHGLEAMVVEPFRLIGAAVRRMKKQGNGGRVVMATSAVPYRGLPNYGMYVTARGAQNAMVLSLSRELARDGITVNAVAPNFVENPSYFSEKLLADEAAMAKILSQIPLGRMGRGEEVSDIVAFLLSDKSGFVTGHVVPVAGGWA